MSEQTGDSSNGRSRAKEAPSQGTAVVDARVQVGPDRYRVAVLQIDHHHRWQIELDGVIVASHDGARPENWPGEKFPAEVQEAVTDVALQLSWP
jgi:hypothetical protein